MKMVFETAKKQRSTHLAQLTRLYKDLEKHMVNKENKEKVDELYLSLCSRYEHFKTAHFTCVDNCENSSVIENLEESYKSQKQNYDEFKEHFKRWNDDCDNESDIGSVASSRNQLRSGKIKRMIAENKMKTLKERMRLEHQQREIENRKQMLDIESEIEEARIEESVWEDDGNEHDSKIRDVEETQRRVDVQINVEKETRLLSTSNTTTTTTTSEIDIAFNRLANTLQEGFNLPKPEILTFDGNVLDYCKFIKNFETNVESKVSDNRLRLSYLIQYCTGEAKSCIEDCVLMDSNEGYEQARSILCSRYGRSHVIARTCIDKLLTGPQIQASDVDGLSKLALDMQKCQITLSQLGFVSDVDNSENLRKIVRRLPLHLRTKWADTAHSIYETGKEPCFKNLMKFVDERARVARSIYGIDVAQESSKQKYTKPENWSSENVHRKKITTLSSFSEDDRECGCCSGKCADLSSCRKFTNMKLEDRQNFVVKNRLCFNCLKRNHMSRKCRKEKMCKVSECSGKHHTLLHSWTRIRDVNEAVQPSVNCATSKGSRVKTCLGIIPVKIQCKNGRSFHTHALLDDGADKTLCDERLLKKIGCTGKRITFQISTVNSTGNDVHGREVDLNVSSAYGDGTITIKNVWTVKKLPISLRSAATIKDIRNVSYLSDIQIPDVNVSDVMLLIGTDAPEAHIPVEVRSGNEDQPYAIRSKLGWAVRGPIGDASSTPSASVNFQQSSDNVLQEQLERLWTTDFRDGIMTEKECMSVEDTMALDKMKSSIVHQDGHYKMDLPWRDENKALPNDLPLAQARLTQLKRKLSRDPKLHEMYSTAMNSYIENGYATEVDEPSIVTSKTWYLPHHPVLNANKPGKVRVVFDCAAKYKGISLNSQLLQGSDLMNNLVGVVIRFRQEKIALAADIEAMFHQVNVTERDCDSLRFLWWPNGDMNKPLKTYCMRVHLFGATSSPSCTAYALKRTASDNRGLYEEDVIQTVERNFYVDDCLKSVPSEDKAIQLAENLQSLMKRGGFRLTKWLSNSRKVLNAIPESERAPSVINLGPNVDLPCDRALGVGWDVNKDTIQFNVKITEKPPTRRGLLSIASSIFDPLGYVAPITLRAKAIIQSLCRKGIGWDEDIPAPERSDWNHWLSSIPSIGRIQINRCYKPTHFQEMKSTQLHLFCDGSEAGYGACAYIRLEDVEGNVVCPLVIGKSRLAPIKQMSIPRLELSAATLACQLYGMLSEELELDVESVTFWTDSTIVLGYINNMTTRFKTFVGNRLRIIHDATKPSQWRHVDTDSNPADIASRGISGADTEKLHKWLYGPSFLLKSDDYWPRNMLNNITNDLDLLLSEFCQLYPDTGEPPPPSKLLKCLSKKPMQFENCSAFGGSSTSGTLTSTDSNLSNKDVRSATLTSTDSNNSVTKATSRSIQSSQIDVFGFSSSRAVEQPGYPAERPASQSRSTSGSDLRQITVLERLTKTHPIWFLPTVGRSGAVHLVKNREIGIFIVRKSSREEIMALSVQFPNPDGTQNVDHYLIEPTENWLHLQGSTKLFPSVPHLIAHYCDNKEDLPHRLVLPPSIRDAKTSQELSALAMLGQDFWTSPKYDSPSKSRSSSRSNLSDHSSQMNKSVSEPISINNNKIVPAYSQSEAILQNTPPKHSVIDFSSYLIRKPDENHIPSITSERRLTESVQKSCSVTTTENHSSHVSSFTCFVSSSEMVHTENSVITVTENMCNRNSSVSADYAFPDKTKQKLKSNPCFSTPVELSGIPEDYYFRSNLSDKLSDYEDIWKYAESNVGSVQADIAQRLQPNVKLVTNNQIIRGRTCSASCDVFSEECFNVKDLSVNLQQINQTTPKVRSQSESNVIQSAMLINGFHENEPETMNQATRLTNSDCDRYCDTESFDCLLEKPMDILCIKPVSGETFSPIPEHDNISDDDADNVHGKVDEHEEEAYTEDGDVFPKISSVQTQTSPPWKTKSPVTHFSRRSASTSSLCTMRTPVYSEPFDAINPDDDTEPPNQDRKPKLPKKLRRKSAPAVSHSLRRKTRSENSGRKVASTETEKNIIEGNEVENICEDQEVFVLSGEHDSNLSSGNTQKSNIEKLYEMAWVVSTQSEVKKPKPNKPKPSPRKTKLVNSEKSVSDHKSVTEVTSNQFPSEESKEPVKFTINVLEQLKTLQEFGESHELPSSPVLNKFPVYERQTSMETRVSYSEGSTAEDMISSWNPELTLKPIKLSPVLPVYSAMSEYDNLNSIPYMAPSHQSMASNGTIFCKPWENSVLGKIMKSENSLSHVKSPPPKETPPPLPPPMDMLERIKAWQQSSQDYHDYPNETLNNEYRQSAVTDINSIDAVQSQGDIGSNSECRVSSNGQNSQSSEKTLVNEKPASHSQTKDKVCDENIPYATADIREKVAPVLANPRLLNKPQRNRSPDTKIRDYIISLSKDHSTTFGSTIENFIQCTLDSQDTNPFNITRNVRQFMNGIKNYLVKHGEGELEDLIERERSKLCEDEILNIDAIIENSLHECVIQPLKQNIYRLFVNEYTRNGNLKLLSNNIKYARTKTPEEIGIRRGLSPPDGSTLEQIKHYLLKMQKSYSPMKKLENLLGATSTIYKCVASKQRGNAMCFGADDFLPMLIYVLVHCGTLSVEIEADYMWGLLHPSLLTGEGGYYLTSLSSAVLVLKKFKEMQETKATQQQGKLPSISDMQGFLKIALPNETNDTIEWKTLPVRPTMTTKDVCSMIAHKFKITNPQDYGLYTLENGEECRMMDMECPQTLKADRLAREKECKFVYKRHAANIAWPKSVK